MCGHRLGNELLVVISIV